MPDKTLTQKTIVAAHVDRLNIDTINGEPTLAVTYHVLDGSGSPIGNQRSVVVSLTAGQVTTLKNFVVNVVLPAVNAAEGT